MPTACRSRLRYFIPILFLLLLPALFAQSAKPTDASAKQAFGGNGNGIRDSMIGLLKPEVADPSSIMWYPSGASILVQAGGDMGSGTGITWMLSAFDPSVSAPAVKTDDWTTVVTGGRQEAGIVQQKDKLKALPFEEYDLGGSDKAVWYVVSDTNRTFSASFLCGPFEFSIKRSPYGLSYQTTSPTGVVTLSQGRLTDDAAVQSESSALKAFVLKLYQTLQTQKLCLLAQPSPAPQPEVAPKPTDQQPFKVELSTAIPKLKQLVPGMEGAFDVRITYSGTEPVGEGTLHASTTSKFLSLLPVQKSDTTVAERLLDVPSLNPGQVITLKDKILYRVGTEEVPEIFEKVIKTIGGSIPLKGALQIKLIISPNSSSRAEYNLEPEIAFSDGSPINVEFPNFTKLVGAAGPVVAGNTVSAAEASYNLQGDPGWGYMDNPEVRKLAIHAARYDALDLKPEEFPDSARVAAYNIKTFIYRLLNPKWDLRSGAYREPGFIAVQANAGTLTPKPYDPKADNHLGYVCIEHAFLFTSLLRTLGIPAKEANAILYSIAPVIYQQRIQSAAVMAWIDDSQGAPHWQYLDAYKNFDSPAEYLEKLSVGLVKVWYGAQSTPAKTFPVTYSRTTVVGSYAIPFTEQTISDGTRFTLPDVQMDKSPLWKFYVSKWQFINYPPAGPPDR
ncbi:MAG: hypothetical protein ABSD88_10100 [Candidatus Korobacteraceae bacterium]